MLSAVCTEGIRYLQAVPDGTVDFIWSHAVLEHIRKDEFLKTMRELRRVLRQDSVCSHRIDLQDHLGSALNNMRFSSKVWESNFMTRSGFYTNRIRYSEMLNLFDEAGFETNVIHIDRLNKLPTPRRKLSSDYSMLSDDELLILSFDAILKPQ